MLKALTFPAAAVLAVSMLAAAPARGQDPLSPEQTILLANASGLNVRLKPSEARHLSRLGNPIGAAINTMGVARATIAILVDGRAYLAAEVSRPSVNAPAGELASAPPQPRQNRAGL
jgi:hypothetical protein